MDCCQKANLRTRSQSSSKPGGQKSRLRDLRTTGSFSNAILTQTVSSVKLTALSYYSLLFLHFGSNVIDTRSAKLATAREIRVLTLTTEALQRNMQGLEELDSQIRILDKV